MQRTYDILVYGATGFTGQKVASYIHQRHPEIKLAISGRSQSKLLALAQSIGLSSDHVHSASTENQPQLVSTLSQAKIVIACAGPYRHVGRDIVAASILAQTHYLDLCGEPQFFDDMLAEFDHKARDNGTLVISACAFDCVPAELTAKLASRELKRKFKNCPVTNLEIVHTFQGFSVGNPTTFHAAVDGFHAAAKGELRRSRERVEAQLNLKALSGAKPPPCPSDWPSIVVKPEGITPLYHPETETYLLKFVGADAACILASDRYLRYRRAIEQDGGNSSSSEIIAPFPRMSVCLGLSSKSAAYKVLGYGAIFSVLARFGYGCKILHSNPSLFSNGVFRQGGPTEEEMEHTSFKTYCTAYGMNKEESIRVTCSGPEPGYVATPKMIVALALTVLHHREEVKFDGGVMLPGAAFGDSDVALEMLKKEGVIFEVMSDDAVTASVGDAKV